jgi:hypothetical protein
MRLLASFMLSTGTAQWKVLKEKIKKHKTRKPKTRK